MSLNMEYAAVKIIVHLVLNHGETVYLCTFLPTYLERNRVLVFLIFEEI